MKQLNLDLITPPQGYKVFIGGKIYHVASKEDAWEVIGSHSLGAIYSVYDQHDQICADFIPL